MIVLIGFMGAGKSSVGRLLADALGLPFVDTDQVIQTRSGRSIPELFEQGESAFREIERDVVAKVLAGPPSVVALGGGALGDPATCAELEWAQVVHLDVSLRDALTRIGHDPNRPMLSVADPKALFVEREVIYARVADLRVDTVNKDVALVVAEVLDALGRRSVTDGLHRVEVPLGDRSYAVTIGAGLIDRIPEIFPEIATVERVMLVTQPALRDGALRLSSDLQAAGIPTHTFELPEGEGAKSLAHAGKLYDGFAQAGAHRNDLVIGFGGGVITDVAGFVASTYNRGIRLLQIPTTLLGQVDAAIGGKTALNIDAGKNLVGSFYQPEGVFCDVDLLGTLPQRELVAGAAEVAKYGFISDPSILDLLRDEGDKLLHADRGLLTQLVARSVGIKAAIVSADERDRGDRALLNYGHTIGHAIEHAWAARDIRHGEAISLGMVGAAAIAEELGLAEAGMVAHHRAVLGGLGLPVVAELDVGELEPFWKLDKKFDRGLRFVLLKGIGRPVSGVEVPRDVLVRAVGRMTGT